MSDAEEEFPDLKPAESLCNTCRHGMCIEDNDLESFVQPATIAGDAFDDRPEEPGVNQTKVPIQKVRSVCFWRPKEMMSSMMSPLVFNCVTECSKYDKN